jgi:2-phosphoglycerate kinase
MTDITARAPTRVILIGGSSHAGKSSAGRLAAARLGWELAPTDGMARHPGRPWPTPTWDVPAHVVEHYETLSPPALAEAQMAHYQRLWPRIEAMIRERAGGPGLVIEGSGVLPEHVARLALPGVAAVWITAAPQIIAERIRRESGYASLSADGRRLADAFTARTALFDAMVIDEARRLGLTVLSSDDDAPEAVADRILATSTFAA